MLLASWALDKRDEWRAKKREEAAQAGRAEGWVEGQMDAHEAWSAWNARRLAAEQNGGDFNEPPPSIEGPSHPR